MAGMHDHRGTVVARSFVRSFGCRKKIAKLHRQVAELNESCEEWAAKKEFNAYRLHKLEQRLRTYEAEADRLNNHDDVYVVRSFVRSFVRSVVRPSVRVCVRVRACVWLFGWSFGWL